MLRRAVRWLWRPGRRILTVYILALLASQIVVSFVLPSLEPAPPATGQRSFMRTPRVSDAGPVGREDAFRLAYLRWRAEATSDSPAQAPPPVVFLHGSPSGGGSDFTAVAPLIADAGYNVYAPSLPGFGASDVWTRSYSIKANAHLVFEMMDEIGIERAHVVGWSQGGGTAIHMERLAPRRIASLTLLNSIGTQETEGSGSYYFEHAKYAVGFFFVVGLPEVIPHFGLLGGRGWRWAFIRNFWDTDQRPLERLMREIEAPTLVLHGREDFLVPPWAAEVQHALIGPSRLVMTPHGHFMPFLQPDEVARHLLPFLQRHDDPGVPPLRGVADLAPTDEAAESHLGPFEFARGASWWLVLLLIILATFISEDATVIAVGLLIAAGKIDWGVGFMGCLIGIAVGDAGLWAFGRFVGRRALRWRRVREWLPEHTLDRWGRVFETHAVKAVFLARAVPGTRLPTYVAAGVLSKKAHRFLIWAALAATLWTPVLLILTIAIGKPLKEAFESVLHGPVAMLAAFIAMLVIIRTITLATTRNGRLRLRASISKPWRIEFWPQALFYLPLLPYLAYLSLRYRGPMSFTCVNPGVPHGGGVVGESKHQILQGLVEGGAGEWVARSHLIEADKDAAKRADAVDRIMQGDEAMGGYPVIIKPDASERGHAVKLLRDRHGAWEYFRDMTRDAVLQAFHPGPHEAGVLWTRRPGAGPDEPGEILSVTQKIFPVLVGDGKRTIEQLIWRHPRYRMQADVFLKRFADRIDEVLPEGERLRLAQAGNHCQGTMFVDGAALVTPAFERRIDSIARSFPGGGFDFGRFDIRFVSEETLAKGEGFAIVELNGTMSESTNLYDPRRSIFWSYSVLLRHWRRLYALGAERRGRGQRPMPLGDLVVALRDHYRGKAGPSISD